MVFRLLDRSQVEAEDERAADDEEDNDLLKAFKVESFPFGFSTVCTIEKSLLKTEKMSEV
jgi:hypothetical protein